MSQAEQIAEMQGMYGPVSIAERVIQKIWLNGDYDASALLTHSGKSIKVIKVGQWNPTDGPDFTNAVLMIGDEKIEGDVEIHFYARDWMRHGHQFDARYSNVVLHVVLYADEQDPEMVRTADDKTIELVSLLPALHQDLESSAFENDLLEANDVELPEWMGPVLSLPKRDLHELLFKEALIRWESKVERCREQLSESSWIELLHYGFLEALGYHKNRTIMREIALANPYKTWVEHQGLAETVYDQNKASFSTATVRPANHPKTRLNQYQQICAKLPDWPWRLQAMLSDLPSGTPINDCAAFRRAHKVTKVRATMSSEILCNVIGGSRLDTLMVDVFLPLASAAGYLNGFDWWFHWPMGDMPKWIRSALKECECRPLANGPAQGVLGLATQR